MKIVLVQVLILICSYLNCNAVVDAGRNPHRPPRLPLRFRPRPVLFGPKKIPYQRGKCMSASTSFLERKLESLGGFNKNMVSVTKVSATRNLKKLAGRRKVSVAQRVEFSKARHQGSSTFRNLFKTLSRGKARQSFNIFRAQKNCLKRGSLTQHGNLNLCESCVVNTHLAANKFPRYLTEIKCRGRRTCIIGQGACVERFVLLTLLQKSGYCVQKSGRYYMEEWVPYQKNIQVGCECELKRGSALAQYAEA